MNRHRHSDPLATVARLADAARGEEPPTVDVSAQVLRRLRQEAPSVNGPLAVFAAASAVAAVWAAIFSISVLENLSDPLAALLHATAGAGF